MESPGTQSREVGRRGAGALPGDADRTAAAWYCAHGHAAPLPLPAVGRGSPISEPIVAVVLGYLTGRFPPGGGGLRKARDAAVNSLRAHAAAYRTLHGAQPNARVNWAYLDALRDGVLRVGPRVRVPEAAGTLDFIGVNYYSRDLVQFDRRPARTLFGRHFPTPGAPISDGGYGEVYPAGLLRVLLKAHQYGLPIYVTENGLPDEDDNLRPGFLIDHLMELWRASRMGCDVRGYFHWSLIDNFEWADGWTLRFGLLAVDPETQIRTPRSSSTLYGEICRRSALPPDAIAARRGGAGGSPPQRWTGRAGG